MEHKHETERALSIYGSANALEEMVMQVALSPQFSGLTPIEHRYVAGVGLASGLNPVFHLHAWKQSKRVKGADGAWKTTEVLTVLPDYKALIASSPDPIMTSDRRLTHDEMLTRGIAQSEIDNGAIAYEVTGTNLKHAIIARKAGIDYTPFKGVGWWAATKVVDNWTDGDNGKRKKQGTKRIPNDTPNGRDGEWVAKKRAIRDLFNQIADLRLKFVEIPGATVEGDEWQFEGDTNAIEGEYTERSDPAWSANAIEKAESYRDSKGMTDDEINAALECADWRDLPITPDEWKVIVDQIAAKKEIAAAQEAANESGAVTIDAETGEVIKGETQEADQPETKADLAASKCEKCKERDATGEGPFPKLCALCATKAADADAAEEG